MLALRPGCKAVATDVCVPISRLAEAVGRANAKAARRKAGKSLPGRPLSASARLTSTMLEGEIETLQG